MGDFALINAGENFGSFGKEDIDSGFVIGIDTNKRSGTIGDFF